MDQQKASTICSCSSAQVPLTFKIFWWCIWSVERELLKINDVSSGVNKTQNRFSGNLLPDFAILG
jgi:hypothetical protein